MIKIENDFPSSNLKEWLQQLEKDLTADQLKKLESWDTFQDLKKNAILNSENTTREASKIGQFPFTMGYGKKNMDLYNSQTIIVDEEKKSNSIALDYLMKGCSSLQFELKEIHEFKPEVLFNNIDFRFISCYVTIRNTQQYITIKTYFEKNLPENFFFNYDYFEFQNNELWDLLIEDLRIKQFKSLIISANCIHDSGANATQEIAFSLAVGNYYLNSLMSKGLTIDQALGCIHFSFGFNSDYLVEVSKIRAFRKVWSLMISKYQPIHACSFVTHISAYTALSNKSISEPYTNLLRQTVEVLAAIQAGVDVINVIPYENLLETMDRNFSSKMAINIPLILLEEGKINFEVDVLGGSYSIENITGQLCKNSWELFQRIEELGGIQNEESKNHLKLLITEKKLLKKSKMESKELIFVGVNQYQTTNNLEIKMRNFPDYMDLPFFNIEM
jgi:methylmalonyl-CoA mutase